MYTLLRFELTTSGMRGRGLIHYDATAPPKLMRRYLLSRYTEYTDLHNNVLI